MRQAARISTAKKGGKKITFACSYSLNIYIIRRLILHINNLTKTPIFSFFFLVILRSNICSIEWKKKTMCVDRPMAYIGLTAMVKWLNHWHIGQRLGSVSFLYNPSVMGLFFSSPIQRASLVNYGRIRDIDTLQPSSQAEWCACDFKHAMN